MFYTALVSIVYGVENFNICQAAVGLIPLNASRYRANVDSHTALFYAYKSHAQIELIWAIRLQPTRCSMQRLLMLYKGAKIYCHFADFKKKFPPLAPGGQRKRNLLYHWPSTQLEDALCII